MVLSSPRLAAETQLRDMRKYQVKQWNPMPPFTDVKRFTKPPTIHLDKRNSGN